MKGQAGVTEAGLPAGGAVGEGRAGRDPEAWAGPGPGRAGGGGAEASRGAAPPVALGAPPRRLGLPHLAATPALWERVD
jgi:hypothetical protein